MLEFLIIKFFRYDSVRHNPKFSFEAAFTRLNGVLEISREIACDHTTTIVIPGSEIEAAKKYVKLSHRDQIKTIEQVLENDNLLDNDQLISVFDEQGFYASPELVKKVINASNGQTCSWDDPEGLLWSFNYHGSCRFFMAPASLVKKYLREASDFPSLQKAVFEESGGSLYAIKPEDVVPVYRRSIKYNPYPYHFYIEPTSRCNSRCIMCPFHSPDPEIAKGRVYLGDGGDDMPLEIFKELIDRIVSIGWNYLPHYRLLQVTSQLRGEPTLATNFREMASYAKEKGVRLGFSTNGSTFHLNGLGEFFIQVGVDEIVVSIDGNEKEYSRIRPQLNYDQVVENLKTLKNLRDEKGESSPVIYTKRVHLRNSTEECDREYIEKFAPIADWAGIAYENYDDSEKESKVYTDYFFEVDDSKRLPCIMASDVSIVKANGNVDFCFGGAEHHLGNIYEKSLLLILRESSLRKQILENQSRGFWVEPSFCKSCTCWKGNYNVSYEEEKYIVRKNPILAYWKKKDKIVSPQREERKRSWSFKNILNKIRQFI